MNKTTEALKPTMQYVIGKEGLTYHCWVAYRPLDTIDDLEKYIAGQTRASFVYEDQAKWFCKQFNDAIAQGLEPFEETSGGGFESRLASPKSALKLAEEALAQGILKMQKQDWKSNYPSELKQSQKALAAIREALADQFRDATKMVAEPVPKRKLSQSNTKNSQ